MMKSQRLGVFLAVACAVVVALPYIVRSEVLPAGDRDSGSYAVVRCQPSSLMENLTQIQPSSGVTSPGLSVGSQQVIKRTVQTIEVRQYQIVTHTRLVRL